METIQGTTGSRGKKHDLDKFYTTQEIADYFTGKIPNLKDYTLIIEPSAGNGVFLRSLSSRGVDESRIKAYDMDPEANNIIESDWFDVEKSQFDDEQTLVIGNPPFGRNGNLAMRFVKESAFAEAIAFIIPRSFKKESVKNRIPANFWLAYEEDTPNNSFTLNGEKYDVPCVFQLWQRSQKERSIPKRNVHSDYILFTTKADADFRIQRVGGNSGKASLLLDRSESSNYFIKNNTDISNENMVDIVNSIDFKTRNYSTGPRSLSKGELIAELESVLAEQNISPKP